MPFCVFFWNFRAMTEKSALPTDFLFYLLFLCYSYLINWQVFHFYHLILILYIYIIATIKIIDRFRRSNYLGNQSQVDRTLFQVHIRLGSLVHLHRLILSLNWLVLWILVFFFWTFLYQLIVLFLLFLDIFLMSTWNFLACCLLWLMHLLRCLYFFINFCLYYFHTLNRPLSLNQYLH